MPLKMTDLGEEFLLQEDALNIFWDNETLCQRMQCRAMQVIQMKMVHSAMCHPQLLYSKGSEAIHP